jgi:hypothetical protein
VIGKGEGRIVAHGQGEREGERGKGGAWERLVVSCRRGQESMLNARLKLTLRCDGVRALEYGSGSGLSSQASARKPPHLAVPRLVVGEDTLSRNAMQGWGREEKRTYNSAVSEQLDIVLLAYICHAVERPCVNQRELYM